MFKCSVAVPLWVLVAPLFAQTVELRSAPEMKMPAFVDSNSPAYWYQGKFAIINSNQAPVRSTGDDLFSVAQPQAALLDRHDDFPMWIEAAWMDDDGTLFAWYHHEQGDVCPGTKLAMPEIGALVSYDGGASFHDLGIVLASTDPPDCGAKNGFFAGGTGDFSVILDEDRQYFYFLFDNYGGDLSQQGVAMARMAFADRQNPAGAVWRYNEAEWVEPGIGGNNTPIFPAQVSWTESDTDSFWGPSVHWNWYLEKYVVLLNRSCCSPNWPQKGIYITFNSDLSDPNGWREPDRILEINEYYPEIIGLEDGDTDTLAGQLVRFFVGGTSKWEAVFIKLPDAGDPPPQSPLPPGPSPLRYAAPR